MKLKIGQTIRIGCAFLSICALEIALKKGLLTRGNAWDHIVLLTGQMIDWIYNPDFRYEILLMNQHMLGVGVPKINLPDQLFELYHLYANLFTKYTGNEEGDWALKLAFYTVTSAFDGANYAVVLKRLLGYSLQEKEPIEMMKYNLKSYLTANIKTQLDIRFG